MSDYVLDKGYIATGATAYVRGELATKDSTGKKVSRATVVDVLTQIVPVGEDLDTTRLATGKVVINCKVLGVARVLSGAAILVDARVTNDATARAVPRAQTAGGTAPKPVFGIALTPASAAGQEIDVLLTPGALF